MPTVSTHTLVVQGLDSEIRVLSFEGHEEMSRLFEFVVTIGSRTPIDRASCVRAKASFTILPPRATEAGVVHGIVSRVEEEQVSAGYQYRVTIVPWAWFLLHRVDSRIFSELTTPQIVTRVLEGAGYTSGDDFRSSLQGTYAAREFCVQYRESDWDFVCRLLEEEGILFYFEQTHDRHVLVLADRASSAPPIAGEETLVYRPERGALVTADYGTHVSRFHVSEEIRSGKVTLRDWNFQKPALLLQSTQAGASDTNLELYDYPGDYVTPSDGDALAKVRVEELAVRRRMGGGESTCPRLSSGHKFTLAEHPRDDWNASYVLTRVEHSGLAGDEESEVESADEAARYGNAFEVIPAAVVFRPARVTRRPQIHGVQTAIVVGPPGEEIYADEHGRVKLQFHWDRLGKKNEKSSCWVRVAQMWASAAFGAMFLPRVNDEVIVAFEEGDPDRPLVVGRVYHGTNVPPYSLPQEKTKSTIKSRSSPNGDGYNELRFEDKKGAEEVFLHAQKDWTIAVENDKKQTIGHDESLEVGHDRTKVVKHDQTATVEHDDTLTVKNDQTSKVEHDRSVTVSGDHTENVDGDQSITIGKAQTVAIGDKQEITVGKTRSLSVAGDATEAYDAKVTLTVGGDVSEAMRGKRAVEVASDHTEKVGGKQVITIASDASETVGGKKTLSVTGAVTITSGASTVTIKPSGEITIHGTQIKIDSNGPLQIHGATIDVKSDGPYAVKAAVINAASDAVHTIKGAVVVLDGQVINLG
jgi:type VI secretion system secreted protein VgrG